MLEFLQLPAVLPFTIALAIALALSLVVVITTFLGFGLGDGADADFDVDVDLDADIDIDADIDTDVEIGQTGWGVQALNWLDASGVPKSMLLLVLLLVFGFVGVTIQSTLQNTTSNLLSPWLVTIPSLLLGVFSVRAFARTFKKLKLDGETSAVATDSLLGRTAQITLGETHFGKPSQAKVIDANGLTHHVLVEPVRQEDRFDATTPIVLVARKGAKFFVVGEGAEHLDNLDLTTIETRG